MSVLILEDSPARIKLFRQGFIGTSVTVLTTADHCMAWLADHTPKLICLDYDLDQYGTERKISGCGYDVARFLARDAKRFEHTLVIIHSLNESGAARMTKTLQLQNIPCSRHPNLWAESCNMDRLTREVQDSCNSPRNSRKIHL
jgi:CheY-like chemotaxis protein